MPVHRRTDKPNDLWSGVARRDVESSRSAAAVVDRRRHRAESAKLVTYTIPIVRITCYGSFRFRTTTWPIGIVVGYLINSLNFFFFTCSHVDARTPGSRPLSTTDRVHYCSTRRPVHKSTDGGRGRWALGHNNNNCNCNVSSSYVTKVLVLVYLFIYFLNPKNYY